MPVPILKTLVPHFGQVPLMAGLLFARSYPEDVSSALRTGSLNGGPLILESNILRVLNVSLGFTFHAVGCYHISRINIITNMYINIDITYKDLSKKRKNNIIF